MKIIGLKSIDFFHMILGTNLKKDLLYFDEIIIDQDHFKMCSDMIKMDSGLQNGELEFNLNEIEYLEKIGLVKIENTKSYFKDNISIADLNLIDVKSDYVIKKKNKTLSQDDIQKELIAQMFLDNFESNMNARKICSSLNENSVFNVKPIFDVRIGHHPNYPTLKHLYSNNLAKKEDILNLVLRKLPLPDSQVSWEELIDFRNNTDLKIYRLGLMNWISDIGKSNSNIYEIEQKLDYLLAQYEERMINGKIKYQVGTMELIVTTSAVVLENIVKLNWSKAAKGIFDLKRRNIDLMIGETLAPGREVAYLSKIKEKFK